jgi:hypothetical protein
VLADAGSTPAASTNKGFFWSLDGPVSHV